MLLACMFLLKKDLTERCVISNQLCKWITRTYVPSEILHSIAWRCLPLSLLHSHSTISENDERLLLFLKKTSPTQKWENRWILINFFLFSFFISISLSLFALMNDEGKEFFFVILSLLHLWASKQKKINSFYSPRNKHTRMPHGGCERWEPYVR